MHRRSSDSESSVNPHVNLYFSVLLEAASLSETRRPIPDLDTTVLLLTESDSSTEIGQVLEARAGIELTQLSSVVSVDSVLTFNSR